MTFRTKIKTGDTNNEGREAINSEVVEANSICVPYLCTKQTDKTFFVCIVSVQLNIYN